MIDTCKHIVDSIAQQDVQVNALLREQDSILNTISQDISVIIEKGTDYTPIIKVFAIPLIIAVFTIMVPLVFSVVNRIDTKYSARQFIKLYLCHWTVVVFGTIALLCIFAIIAYAIYRMRMANSLWSAFLCILAILLFGVAIATLYRAIQFNNSQKLLSEIFLKQESKRYSGKKMADFYSLCTHIVHYAIVSDITLLHDFVNKWVAEHLPKLPLFTEELYNALINVAADYKENEDDLEVNAALAFLFASLVDSSPHGLTNQKTYDALFQIIGICNRNKHYTLINAFQRRMRYAYYAINKEAQNNKLERSNRLQLFVLTLNGLLYGKGSMECVEDAIMNNYDTVVIGNEIIIPQLSNNCLDLFLYLREVLMDGKDFAYYFYVASDFTSFSNATLLNRYFSGYFAYLITRMHISKLMPDDLVNSVYIYESKIEDSFDALIRNAIDEPAQKLIKKQKKSYWQCRNILVRKEIINIERLEAEIVKQLELKRIVAKLLGMATSVPIYMEDAEYISHPIMELNNVPRVALMEEAISRSCNFYSKYDFGSRAIECVMDSLADVYNSFVRIEETIHKNDVNKKWLEFVSKYDYSFLTFFVNVPNRVIPHGKKFSSYFPSHSVIAISIPDLPYIEWKGDSHVVSIADVDSNINKSPMVNISVDLHMNIHYKRNTVIHVLNVVD